MTLRTTDLELRIGSEIHAGAEQLLSGGHASRLRELLEQRVVLVFRDLFFTKEQQIAFARSLGRVQPQGEDGVFKITIDPAVSAEYLKGSFFWHIQGASDDMPNFAPSPNAQVLSRDGESTYFANTYAAYEDLAGDKKARYDILKVVHSFEVSQRYVNPEPIHDEAIICRADARNGYFRCSGNTNQAASLSFLAPRHRISKALAMPRGACVSRSCGVGHAASVRLPPQLGSWRPAIVGQNGHDASCRSLSTRKQPFAAAYYHRRRRRTFVGLKTQGIETFTRHKLSDRFACRY